MQLSEMNGSLRVKKSDHEGQDLKPNKKKNSFKKHLKNGAYT